MWAARSFIKHTAAEPMFEHADAGVHITVTLRTHVYTVLGPTADMFDWLDRVIRNNAVAHFVSQMHPPMLILTIAIEVFAAVYMTWPVDK